MAKRLLCAIVLLLFAIPAAHAQKISTLPGASALTGTEIIPCVQSAATDGCTANQIRTLTQTFPSAALSGSPGAGLQEYEGTAFYATPNASNRGVIPAMQFMSLAADYTLTSSLSVQKALNGTTNGQITVPSTTAYLFELNFVITNTGTVSHTWAVSVAGTATLTSGEMTCMAQDAATASSIFAAKIAHTTTPGTALVMDSASTSATENIDIHCWGRLNINAGGTLIPSVQASAAPTGTSTMKAGSYYLQYPIGVASVTQQGNWN
jgi:hypothetical protein